MGYIEDDSFVRVDFFKDSGKWYDSESVKWIGYNGYIYDEFADSLKEHFKDSPNRLASMTAVCLKPYNKYAHPLMFKHGQWNAHKE